MTFSTKTNFSTRTRIFSGNRTTKNNLLHSKNNLLHSKNNRSNTFSMNIMMPEYRWRCRQIRKQTTNNNIIKKLLSSSSSRKRGKLQKSARSLKRRTKRPRNPPHQNKKLPLSINKPNPPNPPPNKKTSLQQLQRKQLPVQTYTP